MYDLNQKIWTSKTEQPEMNGMHSKGAYRSVATSSKQRVIVPVKNGDSKTASVHSYSIDEEGEGGGMSFFSRLIRSDERQIYVVTQITILRKFDARLSSFPRWTGHPSSLPLPPAMNLSRASRFEIKPSASTDQLYLRVFAFQQERLSAITSSCVVSTLPAPRLRFRFGQ